MDYKAYYDRLMAQAGNRLLESYTERHHIIPRCIGGTDDSINLVNLTAKEHYVAHQLLVKIHPDHMGLIKAANMMSLNANGSRPNNKLYGWLRKKHSKAMSNRIVSTKTRENMSKAHMGKTWEDKYGIEEAIRRKKEQSKRLRGIPKSIEHNQKNSEANKGVPKSAKHKRNLSIAGMGHVPTSGMTGKNHTQETKNQMSESHMNKKFTDEHKKNQSIAAKKAWIKRKANQNNIKEII